MHFELDRDYLEHRHYRAMGTIVNNLAPLIKEKLKAESQARKNVACVEAELIVFRELSIDDKDIDLDAEKELCEQLERVRSTLRRAYTERDYLERKRDKIVKLREHWKTNLSKQQDEEQEGEAS
jgi:hypothetical protein